MKSVTLFKGLSMMAFILLFASVAHAQRALITSVEADMKGETFVTTDSTEANTIRAISDGHVIGRFEKGSLDYPAKVLRYKLKDFKLVGRSRKDRTINSNVTEVTFEYKGKAVGKFIHDYANANEIDISAGSSVIAISVNPGRKKTVNFYTINTKDSIVTILPEMKLMASYGGIENFSHCLLSGKGAYSYDNANLVLIETATGKVRHLKLKDELDGYRIFSADEKMLLVGTREGMNIFETATGELVKTIPVPNNIKKKNVYVWPLTDGKSFIYSEMEWKKPAIAWIVREDEVIELKD